MKYFEHYDVILLVIRHYVPPIWSRTQVIFFVIYSVADLGFPRQGGANFQGGDANLLFGQLFPENCRKMKELGPTGGDARLWCPLRSATAVVADIYWKLFLF